MRILSVEEARALYAHGDAAHDFDHVLRVAEMAVRLAEAEGADVTVVRLAALLHDAPTGEKAAGFAAGAPSGCGGGGACLAAGAGTRNGSYGACRSLH